MLDCVIMLLVSGADVNSCNRQGPPCLVAAACICSCQTSLDPRFGMKDSNYDCFTYSRNSAYTCVSRGYEQRRAVPPLTTFERRGIEWGASHLPRRLQSHRAIIPRSAMLILRLWGSANDSVIVGITDIWAIILRLWSLY